MKYEFLIVGQGITGSVLATQLEKLTKTFKIVDDFNKNTSSRVAAGIMHPMSLKRVNLSWRGKDFYGFSDDFYKKFDSLNKTKFYKSCSMIRVFNSYQEQNNWIGRCYDIKLKGIIDLNHQKIDPINDAFGSGEVLKSNHLNVNYFLKYLKNKYETRNILKKEKFDPLKIKLENNIFYYDGVSFENIIMCDGSSSLKNPIFDYLPMIPNKGEIMNVFSDLLPKKIINCGIFCLPIKNKIFTVGSTYSNEDSKRHITNNAKNYLLKKLSKIINIDDISIVNQSFGFRPTTPDRKPFIGEHPLIKNIYTLNGMGSKALLMAPPLAKELLDHIFNSKSISPLVDIKRYSDKIKSDNKAFAKSIMGQ